jgi:hypothetical protein
VFDGDPRLVFGAVEDVAADGRGNLYILDSQVQSVRVFTRAGRFVEELGRPGRGPGEFFLPRALALDAEGRLYVLDVGDRRVDVFRPARGRHRFSGSFRLDFTAQDLCIRDDRLFLLGVRRDAAIHEFTLSGERVRSFAPAPGSGDALLATSLDGGALQCPEGQDALLFLPRNAPEVLEYSAERGSLLWRRTLPGYVPVQVRKNGNRSVTFSAGRSGVHDMYSSVTPLHPGFSLVQVGSLRRGARHRFDFASVKSYVVSNRTGALLRTAQPFPRLVEARGGYAFAVRTDPYPAVTVYQIRYHEGRPR